MDVLISGATGLIGSALIPELAAKGHTVRRLTRHPRQEGDIRWDIDAGTIDGDISGIDAVVHLAGESIAEGRWTEEKKRRILGSRQKGTRLLAEEIAGLDEPPSVMVSVSATGYYGDRGTSCSPRRAGREISFSQRFAGNGRPRPTRGVRRAYVSCTRG